LVLIALAAAGPLRADRYYATVGPVTVGKNFWGVSALVAHQIVRRQGRTIGLSAAHPFATEIRQLGVALARHYPVVLVPRTEVPACPVQSKHAPQDPLHVFDRSRMSDIPAYIAAAGITYRQAIAEALGVPKGNVGYWLAQHSAAHGITSVRYRKHEVTFFDPKFFVATEHRALANAIVERARPQYRAIAAAQRRRWTILTRPEVLQIAGLVSKQTDTF